MNNLFYKFYERIFSNIRLLLDRLSCKRTSNYEKLNDDILDDDINDN